MSLILAPHKECSYEQFVLTIYQPRRPRASHLWQLVHHGWDDFLANYESKHRKTLGPLHSAANATRESKF